MRLLALLLLAACSSGGGSPTCTAADDLDAGAALATVDGAAWASTATWLWQRESLQVNAAPAGGWSFTFVSQTTADGETAKAAVDAGDFPIELSLPVGGEGGWVLAYPTDGDSYSTENGEGGTLTITALDGDALYACFAFDAATDSGDTVTVTDGALNATAF
jgi:hypothetical protein